MEGLKAEDDLGQDLGGLVKGEHFVFEFGLVVDEISSVAVFKDEVDVGIVFLDIVELDDVLGVHGLHALDLSI